MNKSRISRIWNNRPVKIVISTLMVGILLVVAAGPTGTAQAHCDSIQGPVVQAASQALETNNVKLILPYVKSDAEAELIAAFKHARQVRVLSPEARKLADEYFYEVAVRLHREGEGAPYTGLKDEKVPAILTTAGTALETGKMDGLYTSLDKVLKQSLEQKYHAVVEARENARKLGTVAAQREAVEAELMFETYVYEVYSLAAPSGPIEPAHSH